MKSDLVCIIDKSGSMDLLRDDTIGGFNRFLEDQKNLPGEAMMSLTFFSSPYSTEDKILNRTPIQLVKPLDRAAYVPCGNTALLDTIGYTIDSHGKALSLLVPSARPDKVIVAILTDGEENSSRNFKKTDIAERIKHQREKYNWEFIFLGANMDAFAEGQSMQIPKWSTQDYKPTPIGIRGAFNFMSATASSYRFK